MLPSNEIHFRQRNHLLHVAEPAASYPAWPSLLSSAGRVTQALQAHRVIQTLRSTR
jgi:hypothetical protein